MEADVSSVCDSCGYRGDSSRFKVVLGHLLCRFCALGCSR
jgi:hypothetical protein